ncbi:MAG: pantetheine-phosphate adenylyltransferase [Phycisphaerae bacterium]|jgi:pantetheine-phosphate adenylyltransferase
MNKDITAVFPGSFDPITNGHIDVIERGLKLFSRVVVAVGENSVKEPFFTGSERVEMIRELFAGRPEVIVQKYSGLTVEYVREIRADVMLRGLRNLTDVQYEFQLAMTNRSVAGVETVFIMTSEQFGFVSSTLIREVATLGGDVSNLIPQLVYDRLQQRLTEMSQG